MTALAVSSDVFFYKIGEQIFTERGNKPVLEEQVRLFGFGSPTEIDLPYEYIGTVPSRALKERLAASGAIAKEEGRGYYVGDNVQFSIGQGLLSSSPMQLAVGYGALANGGKVLRPRVVRAIWAPGTPNGKSGSVNLEEGTVLQDFAAPQIKNDVAMKPEIRDPIVKGLARVITGPLRALGAPSGAQLVRLYMLPHAPAASALPIASAALSAGDMSVAGVVATKCGGWRASTTFPSTYSLCARAATARSRALGS